MPLQFVDLVIEKHGDVIRRGCHLLVACQLALQHLDERLLALDGPSQFDDLVLVCLEDLLMFECVLVLDLLLQQEHPRQLLVLPQHPLVLFRQVAAMLVGLVDNCAYIGVTLGELGVDAALEGVVLLQLEDGDL